jgi:putative aldouronate transport system permease protein
MVTPITLRSSITVIATLPILVVYPFMQRYFVVGMTIGGVKE